MSKDYESVEHTEVVDQNHPAFALVGALNLTVAKSLAATFQDNHSICIETMKRLNMRPTIGDFNSFLCSTSVNGLITFVMHICEVDGDRAIGMIRAMVDEYENLDIKSSGVGATVDELFDKLKKKEK